MLYAIRRTHRDGVSLPRDMVLHSDKAIGNLLIERAHHNDRSLLVARLLHVTDTRRPDLLPSLMRVEIEAMTDQGFLLSGFELVLKQGARVESVQGWWATSAGAG